MAKPSRTLETSRLEIILLAIAVFVLVALLAILILVCVSLKQSHSLPATDLTDTHYGTAWGGSWSERWDAGPLRPYQDFDEDFLDHVRRQSEPLAEDVRRGLARFQNFLPLRIPSVGNVIDQRFAETANTAEMIPKVHSQALECNMSAEGFDRDVSESSASSTARESTLGTTTRRLERTVTHDEDFDLEAQDPEN
ncbi:hypothetical protein E4U54_003114 [Claviceps lovelessii]|nr:hypothetical protein E4U54_003114 [Claviceps lovelessii]